VKTAGKNKHRVVV